MVYVGEDFCHQSEASYERRIMNCEVRKGKGKGNSVTHYAGIEGSRYVALNSAPDKGGCSEPLPNCITGGQKDVMRCTGGFIGPRAGLNTLRTVRVI
jgi:hypothetical protein